MNFQNLIIIFFSFAFINSCKKGKNNPDACNGSSTRRDIKLCVDQYSNLIDTNRIVIDIATIGSIDVIEVNSETPRQDIEKKVYQVTGIVDKVKRYRDGDYHIRIKDQNDNYLICESPNYGCSFAEDSPYVNIFKLISVSIEKEKDSLLGKEITITGVAFIDLNHHYKRKQAKNNIELHPILDIKF